MTSTGTRKPRAGRPQVNCSWCGQPTPLGAQSHQRTTCSNSCMSSLASEIARARPDSFVMPISDVRRYLELMASAELAPEWRAKIMRSEAESLLDPGLQG